jgi:hypothetical protein
MKLLAGAAALIALGAGLGTYFALGGSSAPEVPKAQQSAILERAKTEGVIDAYRVRGSNNYVVGDQVHLYSATAYCARESVTTPCPHAPIFIEYRSPAVDQAQAIFRIASERAPNALIKLFDVTSFR